MNKATDPFEIALNLRGAFGLRDLDEWPLSLVQNAADVLEAQAREIEARRAGREFWADQATARIEDAMRFIEEAKALRVVVGAARGLLLAVDSELDPARVCNCYHPTLAPAADALRIALTPLSIGV